MELTQEIADRYVGGQIEVQNPDVGYLYRGEIATITVIGDHPEILDVTLSWNAKLAGFPRDPAGWVKDDRANYSAVLPIFYVHEIGDGRLCMRSAIVGETTVLYPPDGSKLDPSKVEGLALEGTPS